MPPVEKSGQRKTAARAGKAAWPDALAEAAWAEADVALAEAVIEAANAERAAAAGDAALTIETLAMLRQALGRAARKRGLRAFGDVGATEPYDAAQHALEGAATASAVRVVAPGIARGGEILVKARVTPIRRRKPS